MAKILTFGDSIMKGVVTDPQLIDRGVVKYKLSDNSFVARCERKFGFPINNLARFGSTIANGLKSLCMNSAKITQGDYVVLEFGGNDCNFDWKAVAANPVGEHRPFTTIDDFRQTYIEIIRRVRQLGGRPVLLSLPPIDGRLFFDYVCKGLDRTKIMQFIGNDVNYIQNWHEQYNLEVFKIAMEERVPVIDISSAFLERRDLTGYYCADGMHPNDAGHRLIAEAILAYCRIG